MENQTVYQFNRNENETICANLSEFKDKTYLDLRIFFQPAESDELRPTKKGLTIPVTLLGELKKAVFACEKRVSEKMRQK